MPKQVEAGKLRNGSFVMIDGEPCEVRDVSKSSPGKHGSAKAKIKARGLFDEKDRHITKPADTMMLSPDMDKKVGQVVSQEEDVAQVMDMDTYETEEMQIPDDFDVSEGQKINYWVVDDRKLFKGVEE
ncbi:translation initiation factor IF-5A [Candidatus Nanosalina sp. VS9-1]|uniref:translation initiation factor IF-5A n=1 Tax=Candidatus Nanosalina sp. VS9-1 TaxID=3388566 RepID=UPI0039E028D5